MRFGRVLRATTWAMLWAASTASGAAAEKVRFTYKAASVGDQVRQDLTFQIQLETSTRRGQEQEQSSEQRVERREQRKLALLETGARRARAKVTFEKVEQRAERDGQSEDAPAAPVVGKSYLVTRDQDRLTVTDLKGNAPPDDELAIVERSMAAFGRPSTLAKFFDGKTLETGQVVQLPSEVAKDVFGAGDTLGDVTRFDMKFLGAATVDQARCGKFETTLEAKSKALGNLTMLLGGTTYLEIDTCRAVATTLKGPIGMFEARTSQGQKLEVQGRGTLQIAIRAQRQSARR